MNPPCHLCTLFMYIKRKRRSWKFWFYFDLKAQSCSVTLCHDLPRPQTDRRLNTHRSHGTSVLNCDKDTVHVNFAAFRTNALSGHPPTFIEPSQVLHERVQAKTYTRWMGWLAVSHQDVESIDTAYASQKLNIYTKHDVNNKDAWIRVSVVDHKTCASALV